MLTDNTLLWSALIITVVGLAGLYYLLLNSELPIEHLTVVSKDRLDDDIRIIATITSSRITGNVTLLTLSEYIERKAVIFAPVNLTNGARVEVVGQVAEYNGEYELILSKITEQ